jgi:hypothetical protein
MGCSLVQRHVSHGRGFVQKAQAHQLRVKVKKLRGQVVISPYHTLMALVFRATPDGEHA